MPRNEKQALSTLLPPGEHSPSCRESGLPDMIWQQQIRSDLPVVGHCRRCGAVGRKVVR